MKNAELTRANRERVLAWRPPRAWFAEWWKPRDLIADLEAQVNLFDGDMFFNAPNLKPLREAHVASHFALGLSEDERHLVRLVDGNFPDFQIKNESVVDDYEIVEADIAGRKRGAEYRNRAHRKALGEELGSEPYNPWRGKRLAPAAICAAIRLKADKMYDDQPNLVVHVNIGNLGGPAVTPEEARTLTAEWHSMFKSIWLLCGTTVVPCTARAV